MDGQQYLNQITPTPNKHSSLPKFLSNTAGKLIVGGIIATILIIIVGSALKGETHEIGSDLLSLKAHLDSFSETITKYGSHAKDSTLRTATNDLSTALANSNQELTDHLTEKYEFSKNGVPEETAAAESEYFSTLNAALLLASSGQSFDHAYARKMALAINRLMDTELGIYNYATDADEKNMLATFYNDLLSIYNSFNNYSK